VIKDLAALFFSSIDIGLTTRDFYRFLRSYRKDSLRRILSREATFWQRVLRRAVKLYRREFKRDPQLPKFFLRDE
jgi:heptose I phosphotransferase